MLKEENNGHDDSSQPYRVVLLVGETGDEHTDGCNEIEEDEER